MGRTGRTGRDPGEPAGRGAQGSRGARATRTAEARTAEARAVAAAVVDPELPMLTLADLGVLRDVRTGPGDTVVVEITPTYTGCPAVGVMRADLLHALHSAGFPEVEVRTVLGPPWTTDWISEAGRRALAAAGIAPPGAAPVRPAGPVPLDLGPTRRTAGCPLCGSADTEQTSEFGATACTALRRCRACREPFEHLKEI